MSYGNFTKMNIFKLTPSFCLLKLFFLTLAIGAWPSSSTANDIVSHDFVVTTMKGAELKLETRHKLLSVVLDEIAFKSHVPIHYSALPEGLVTATCVGSTLKQILGCLLNKKTDFIMSYSDSKNSSDQKDQAAEVWILGSKYESSRTIIDCTLINTSESTLQTNESTDNSEINETESLLMKAESKNATERASAMGELLAEGRIGDPEVRAILERGLTDENANVRAQAISSLAHREGNAANTAIQQALNDDSVEVRLMAVDAITDNSELLQQAINDNDEVVRNVAKTKLSRITHAK